MVKLKSRIIDIHSSKVFESWAEPRQNAITLHMIDRWLTVTLNEEDFEQFYKDVIATRKKLHDVLGNRKLEELN